MSSHPILTKQQGRHGQQEQQAGTPSSADVVKLKQRMLRLACKHKQALADLQAARERCGQLELVSRMGNVG